MKRLTKKIELPMNSPLSGADSTDYSWWFVCSTVGHALFPAQEQGKSAADTTKLKPSVVFLSTCYGKANCTHE